MRDRIYNNPTSAEDRAERLICRALDGEITPIEQNELETLIGANPAIASMYKDYQRIDALASDALHADFHDSRDTAGAADRAPADGYPTQLDDRRAWSSHLRVGAITALLAAAAVIVIATLPFGVIDTPNGATHVRNARHWPNERVVSPSPMRVDYQRPIYQPQRLEGDVYQDVIGVRGDDPNTIIILERLTRQSRVDAVSGDI